MGRLMWVCVWVCGCAVEGEVERPRVLCIRINRLIDRYSRQRYEIEERQADTQDKTSPAPQTTGKGGEEREKVAGNSGTL